MRRRKTYDERTGRNTRAAATLARAISRPVVEIVEENPVTGYVDRAWRPEEMQRYSNQDIAAALAGQRVFDEEELLQSIPPSAIKYAVTQKWLSRGQVAGQFWVTVKAATELKLPRKAGGMTLKFAKVA